jgi:hypothetical protein
MVILDNFPAVCYRTSMLETGHKVVKNPRALGAMEGAVTVPVRQRRTRQKSPWMPPSRRMAAFNPFLSANDPKGRMVIFAEVGTEFALSLSLSLSLI